MFYEVRVFDGGGNLLNTISPQELEEKSTTDCRSLLSKRDIDHVMSLEDEEQVLEMSTHFRA